ncbi:MAG TPA: hypothetical protein PLR83_11125 [Pyrinomonadaceae bacterium]|nr:hypothetical protein [Pyrinomonadaceae bacterium]
MKIRNFLLLALAVACIPIGAIAQTPSLTTAYETWKADLIRQRGSLPEHYALTSVTERDGFQRANIRFLVAGKVPTLELEICPLTRVTGSDGKAVKVTRGEKFTAKQELESAGIASPSELNIKLPVNASDNAVEVKWTIGIQGQTFDSTMILPLNEAPSTNIFAIVSSPPGAMENKPVCPVGCFASSTSTEACGFAYSCARCQLLSQATFDFTLCTTLKDPNHL